MPRERRKIIFDREELAHAVASYSRMTPDFLPAGAILGVRFVAADCALLVDVEMRYGERRQQVEIAVSQEALLELLVRACLENNIPIPRRAAKELRAVDDDLAIVIDLEPGDPLALVAPPPAAEVVPLRRALPLG